MATRRKRSRLAAVMAVEEDLALRGHSPAAILRDLQDRAGKGDFPAEWIPSRRTIERDVNEIQPPDPSGLWSFSPVEGEDATFVLTTLATVIYQTGGRVTRLGNRTADWVQAIHAVVPDLDPWNAFVLARMYEARGERNLDVDDLDAWLAFGPWRGPEAASRYGEVVSKGWVALSPVAMNVASRVVIAAAALGAPDKAPKPRPKGRKVRTVEGALVDPEVYEDLMKFEDRLKAPVRRAIDGE
jgi:hypothetical protein